MGIVDVNLVTKLLLMKHISCALALQRISHTCMSAHVCTMETAEAEFVTMLMDRMHALEQHNQQLSEQLSDQMQPLQRRLEEHDHRLLSTLHVKIAHACFSDGYRIICIGQSRSAYHLRGFILTGSHSCGCA